MLTSEKMIPTYIPKQKLPPLCRIVLYALRRVSGYGMMDCRRVLDDSRWNMDDALRLLRKLR